MLGGIKRKVMAEKISDEKFKAEMMKFIEVANQKFDGLTSDIRSNSFKLDRLESKLDHIDTDVKDLTSNVKTFSKQFDDVGSLAIKDSGRITKLEERVDELETGIH